MKAIVVPQYGGPEVLSLEDAPVPVPGNGAALVRVAAAGVGPWDALIAHRNERGARHFAGYSRLGYRRCRRTRWRKGNQR